MKFLNKFWRWYGQHLALNTRITTILFILQLIHLYWLSADVVAFKLTGQSYFPVNNIAQLLLILVDYTEIPALLTTTVLYIFEFRQRRNFKAILFIILLNSQWLHLFWISDEFIVAKFLNSNEVLPGWLAWVAISIDYLELPVIIDAVKKFIQLKIKKT